MSILKWMGTGYREFRPNCFANPLDPLTMAPNHTNREKIAIDQIQRLTAQGILGIGATASCSVILAVALYGVSPKIRLLFWIGTFLAVCLARILLQDFYMNRPLITTQPRAWGTRGFPFRVPNANMCGVATNYLLGIRANRLTG
jgi:hypothetical protein